MDNKKLGIILVIIAIVLAGTIYLVKEREDAFIEQMVVEQGTCFLDDDTCIHSDRSSSLYIFGWVIAAALAALAAYLIFFEKAQKEIVSTLEKQKHIQVEEEKFDILMKGLDEEEKKVMKAVKEQDGITQQTLRLRTDLHKSKLSIVLDGLEKKDLIARKEKGKTKQVFLKISL